MIRDLLRLAAPISAAHLANMALQVVDTYYVGKLSPAHIGAVSVGNAVFMVFMVTGIGFLLSLDFKVSHAFGAKNLEKCHEYLLSALFLSMMTGIVFTLMMLWISNHLVWFGVAPEILELSQQYLKTLALSLAPFLLFSAVRQYLQAFGVVMPTFILLLVANIVNAVANWLFVFGNWNMPNLGVAGSGMATTISRVFMLVCVLVYLILFDLRKNYGLLQTKKNPQWHSIKALLVLGIPIAFQLILEVGIFAGSTLLASQLGANPLAAHQIVLQIASLTFMIPLGLGAACAVRVGYFLGAKNPQHSTEVGDRGILMGGAVMLFFGTVLFLFSQQILSFFTLDENVLTIGKWLLFIAAFFQLFDGVQVVSTGALRGRGNTRSSLWANLIGHWFIGLPIGGYLCFYFNYGIHGLWVGLCIGLIYVASHLFLVWRKQTQSSRGTVV